jgi:hypothetical protein
MPSCRYHPSRARRPGGRPASRPRRPPTSEEQRGWCAHIGSAFPTSPGEGASRLRLHRPFGPHSADATPPGQPRKLPAASRVHPSDAASRAPRRPPPEASRDTSGEGASEERSIRCYRCPGCGAREPIPPEGEPGLRLRPHRGGRSPAHALRKRATKRRHRQYPKTRASTGAVPRGEPPAEAEDTPRSQAPGDADDQGRRRARRGHREPTARGSDPKGQTHRPAQLTRDPLHATTLRSTRVDLHITTARREMAGARTRRSEARASRGRRGRGPKAHEAPRSHDHATVPPELLPRAATGAARRGKRRCRELPSPPTPRCRGRGGSEAPGRAADFRALLRQRVRIARPPLPRAGRPILPWASASPQGRPAPPAQRRGGEVKRDAREGSLEEEPRPREPQTTKVGRMTSKSAPRSVSSVGH